MRWRLRSLLLAFGLVAVALGLGRFVHSAVGPIFPRSVLDKLAPGMTKAQVQSLVGPPARTYGEDQWQYQRAFNPGWVEIWFDGDGKLLDVNDESIYRPSP